MTIIFRQYNDPTGTEFLLAQPTKLIVGMEVLLASLHDYAQFATEATMGVYLLSRTRMLW